MPSKKTTTVVLSEEAQKIKDSLGPAFGLKAIHSAAYIWFNQLSAEQQREIARVAKQKPKTSLLPIVLAIIEQNKGQPKFADAVRAVKNAASHYEMLGGEDKELMDETFLVLRAEVKRIRKKRKSGT